MAALFSQVGWPAVAIDGSTPQAEREQHIASLRAGELTTIFSRDVFNEGGPRAPSVARQPAAASARSGSASQPEG
jgi:superfamily II DNA/RNA helicase